MLWSEFGLYVVQTRDFPRKREVIIFKDKYFKEGSKFLNDRIKLEG